ncbi:MAG: DUF3617 family protein [Betaproteobacteria bacterium]|nr:DUF3617 family protein [Betaproteobacteria bacterium]
MRAQWMVVVALQATAFSTPGLAADMSPGLWEITLETRVAAQPGFAPAPFRLKQCLTAADTRNPSALLGGIANPGASGCTYTNKAYSGNTFRFSMQCAGGIAIQSQGEVSFSADSMNGTITAVTNVAGEKTELGNKVSARRLGGC